MDFNITLIINKDNNAIVQLPLAQLSWYNHNMSKNRLYFDIYF